MATYATQKISPTGLTPAFSAVSASDKMAVGPTMFLYVKNGGASPDSVKIDDPNTVAPGGYTAFDADITVSVTNAQERMIGPVTDRFAAAADGLAVVTHSFTTSVTAGAFVI